MLAQRLNLLSRPVHACPNGLEVVLCQFDNRQAGSFSEYAAVQQTRQCGGAGAVHPQADAEQLALVEDGLGSLLHSGSGSLSEAVHGQTGRLQVSLKEVRDERVEIHDAVIATGFGLVKGSANPHGFAVTLGRIISDYIKAARVI